MDIECKLCQYMMLYGINLGNIQHILTRHEQGAAHAAEVGARVGKSLCMFCHFWSQDAPILLLVLQMLL